MAKRWKVKRQNDVEPQSQPLIKFSKEQIGLYIIGGIVILSMVLGSLLLALSG